MSDNRYEIVCGECEGPLHKRNPESGPTEFGCPDCGNWTSEEEVVAIAKEYATDAAQISLNKKMAEVAWGSKMMSFDGPTRLTKSYRFKAKGFLE